MDVSSTQRPWPKIIEQDQTSGQVAFFMFARDRRKVCHFSKNKSVIERGEHVVLMTWENETRPQLPNCFSISFATVRQRDTENRKIDIFNPGIRRRARNSARIDVDSFAGRFDNKCERLANRPVGRFDWLARSRSSGKRNFSKQAIVLRGENANCPWTDALNASRFHSSACSSRNSK